MIDPDEIEVDDQAKADVQFIVDALGLSPTDEERRKMELMAQFDNSRYEGGEYL